MLNRFVHDYNLQVEHLSNALAFNIKAFKKKQSFNLLQNGSRVTTPSKAPSVADLRDLG